MPDGHVVAARRDRSEHSSWDPRPTKKGQIAFSPPVNRMTDIYRLGIDRLQHGSYCEGSVQVRGTLIVSAYRGGWDMLLSLVLRSTVAVALTARIA